MTKLRQHRGSLDESMKTVQPCSNLDELHQIVQTSLEPYGRQVKPEAVHVAPYAYDERIDWDTHIVTVDGYGVFGFTDGPPLPPRPIACS